MPCATEETLPRMHGRAMVGSLIGKDLSRAYEFSGNQLFVKSTNPSEHWRVAWEHYWIDRT
jgi:hypothetical protein